MLQLQIVLIIFAILTIVSAIPIIDLKYHSDLYDYIDTFNEYCFQNDEDDKLSLPEKETYMWKICHYLYDFNIINITDIYRLKVYQSFSYYGGFSFGIIFLFIAVYLGVSISYYYLENYYHFSLWVFILIFIIIFIVLFSIILKKITEIYNDTYVYHYSKFINNINLLLSNTDKITNVKTGDEVNDTNRSTKLEMLLRIRDRSDNLIIIDEFLEYLVNNSEFSFTDKDNNDQKATFNKTSTNNTQHNHPYTYQNVDMYPIYHSKEQKDNIKYKINVVVSYLIAYFILLVALFLLFARTYDDYFLYVYIIIMLVIAITGYYIYSALR